MELDEILSQLKKGDYSHFQEFYNQTSKSLFFTALMILKDEHLANDIVQESYVKMFQNIDSLDPKQKINYYLMTIARNLAINEYNKRKREITDEEAIAQAEAKYNTEKQKIENKEETLDLKMKNLDTEMSSLTTEYDTVKSLISKNIEKGFKRYDA